MNVKIGRNLTATKHHDERQSVIYTCGTLTVYSNTLTDGKRMKVIEQKSATSESECFMDVDSVLVEKRCESATKAIRKAGSG